MVPTTVGYAINDIGNDLHIIWLLAVSSVGEVSWLGPSARRKDDGLVFVAGTAS